MKEVKVARQDWMTEEVYQWAVLEEQARINTLSRLRRGGKEAIVAIKAQHPLNSDGTPGPEYEQRLQKALAVGHELEAKGLKVSYITFGGVHEGHKTGTQNHFAGQRRSEMADRPWRREWHDPHDAGGL